MTRENQKLDCLQVDACGTGMPGPKVSIADVSDGILFFFSYFSTSSLTDLLVDLFGNKHNKGGHILLFHLRSVLVPFAPGHGVGWTAKFIVAEIPGELR